MDLDPEDLEQTVRRTAVLPVDRQAAWARLADAVGLRSWLAEEVDLEVQVGERGMIRLDREDARLVEVEEVEPMRRLSFIWQKPGEAPSLVELTLDDVEQGTRLTVIEVPVLALRAATAIVEGESRAGRGPTMLATPA